MVDLRLVNRHALARYAAPAAFLLAVTIVVLLVRTGLNHHSSPSSQAQPAAVTTTATETATIPYVPLRRRRYYRIQPEDTLSHIALRFQTTVGYLKLLNPGVDPTNLTVGRRLRIH